MKRSRLVIGALAAAVTLTAALTATASHSWNNYHWARTTSSFTLQVIDSNTSDWDDELNLALSQWSKSSVIDMVVTSRDDRQRVRKRCAATTGFLRSCNAAYGNNGWLGLASINLDSRGHITKATSKVNDSYSSYFADPDQRKHVMCQELGHTIGLDHTSEDGSSQGTCMDYSDSPDSTAPNQHDYEQLAEQYAHLDNYNSYSTSAPSLSPGQNAMAGPVPMGVRVRKGVFSETWVARAADGSVWVHHITLAPGFENTDLLPE
jgi:hypothetical protein